ncbi:MAG TPA: heme-copper oxidase subunit III [Candidatus Thermoplasmatota archaeon]|nr:heme-copper oxidase subunit III [Candidatus Thermoplasmatota archaeon]
MAASHTRHAHEEELNLPHGSSTPIVAAAAIGLLYIGVMLAPKGYLWLLAPGVLLGLYAVYVVSREDATWWEHRVGTGHPNTWYGILFLLGTEVMLFGALFANYFNGLAIQGAAWHPPAGVHMPVEIVGINTIILLASGATMHVGHGAIRRGDRNGMVKWCLATIVLGSIFIAVQVKEYLDLFAEGMTVDSGPFASAFYALTGTHGAHVIGGLALIAIVTWRAMQGNFDERRHAAVEVTAVYWHFVDVVWVVLYAVVYLRLI